MGRIEFRTSTSSALRCEPTTLCAARSVVSVPTRRSSRWKASSIDWPSAVGISGWEMRKRNVIRPGDVWGPGQIMDDGCAGAEECLDRAKPHIDAALAIGKAVGLGLGLKNSGLGNGLREVCAAVVRFRSSDNKVEVRHGFTEMGQGVHTVALQTAVTELGIDPARIEVIVDTTRQLGFGQTTGSRGTLMAAASVQKACAVALAADCAPDVDHYAEHVVDWTQKLGDPNVPEPDDSLRVRLRNAGRDRRQGNRCDRTGRRHPRRGQGGEPATVRGPDRRLGAHGPWATRSPKTFPATSVASRPT